MSIDKEWVTKNLLDKNGSVSRKKKDKNLTFSIVQQMQAQLNYYTPNYNSIIYAYILDIYEPTCAECGNWVKVDKNGRQKFCSLDCLNKSDYMKSKVSEAAQKNASNKERREQINQKRAATNRAKYGVDHVLQIDGMGQKVKEKSNPQRIATLRKRSEEYYAKYGILPQQSHWEKGTIDKLNDVDYLYDLYYNQRMPNHEIAELIGCSPSRVGHKISELGWHRHLVVSTGERQLYEFLTEELNISENEIVLRDRKTFSNVIELDLYLPKYNVAIEYHGLYWHSVDSGDHDSNQNRHKDKYSMCQSKGIRLIQVFEDEWKEKSDIVKSIIRNSLGMNAKTYYGRSTWVNWVETANAKEFMNQNHINGYSGSAYKVGLYDKKSKELISVMTFSKPRFSDKCDYEIVRFASKKGTSVVGGASKMLTFFLKQVGPSSVMTYADLRYGTGDVYNKMGFKYIGKTEPGYFWFWNKNRISRYQTQKHKLPNLLGDRFNAKESESVNMIKAGARKLYDCGHAKYILN